MIVCDPLNFVLLGLHLVFWDFRIIVNDLNPGVSVVMCDCPGECSSEKNCCC